MLMEEYHNYIRTNPAERESFNDFFAIMALTKGFRLLECLAWDIYELQVCMEGLLEDQNHVYEIQCKEKKMKNEKKKKKKVVSHLKGDIKGFKKEIKEDKELIQQLKGKKK